MPSKVQYRKQVQWYFTRRYIPLSSQQNVLHHNVMTQILFLSWPPKTLANYTSSLHIFYRSMPPNAFSYFVIQKEQDAAPTFCTYDLMKNIRVSWVWIEQGEGWRMTHRPIFPWFLCPSQVSSWGSQVMQIPPWRSLCMALRTTLNL